MTAATAKSDLVVAVLTFRRPDYLGDLLPALAREIERLDIGGLGLRSVGVLVVDNDPDRSAQETVVAVQSGDVLLQCPVRYVAEPRPGIAAARNRALRESADSDLLVFIDDDERPTLGWLGLLVLTFRTGDCAAVAGAVESEFETSPDPWVTAGQFFRRRRLPTGTPISVAATNNLLLDLHEVRALGLTFDERFGMTGGEDTLFTRTLVRAGRTIRWCNEAMVIDRVPPARTTRSWVLARSLSSGNSWTATSIALAPTPLAAGSTRIRSIGKGSLRLAGGAAKAVFGTVTRSPAHQAKGLRTAFRGAGMVTGAFGHTYREYGRPVGAADPGADGARPRSILPSGANS